MENKNLYKIDNNFIIKNNLYNSGILMPLYDSISNSKKTVLKGNVGSGKTIVAKSFIKEDSINNNLGVYNSFSANPIFYNDFINSILEGYIELTMADILYSSIENKNFISYDEDKHYNIKKVLYLINKKNWYNQIAGKEDNTLDVNFEVGSIIIPLINKIKRLDDINKVSFIFDRIDSSKVEVLEQLKKYFDIFDRSIIISTTNDIAIKNKDEFNLLKIEYGKKLSMINKIFYSRKMIGMSGINYTNILSKETISEGVKIADGDIRSFLNSASFAADLSNYGYYSKGILINESFTEELKRQTSFYKDNVKTKKITL